MSSNIPTLLASYLDSINGSVPFDWSTNNCAHFAGNWWQLATGADALLGLPMPAAADAAPPWLVQHGGSLADLAGRAPGGAVLGNLLTDQGSAGGPAATSSSLLTTANGYLTSIADSSAAAATHLSALVSATTAASTLTLRLYSRLSGSVRGMEDDALLADLASDGRGP